MKKSIRAIVAALLAIAMALSCTSAFAAEENRKISWDYYGWECSYDYAGELSVGENTLTTPEDSYYCYCIFNAEESGYYTIGFTDYAFDGWMGVPESVTGSKAYNEADCLYSKTESNLNRYTFKFSKGANIIGFDIRSNIIEKNFGIVFEGTEIESVTLADSSLLLGRDIYSYGDAIEIYADSEITFSSGGSIALDYLSGVAEKEITKGLNTVEFSILGETKSATLDVYLISDVIKDVEISNIEDYLNTKVYYDGYEGYYPVNETFTFTLTDGSTQDVVFSSDDNNYVTLPDGSKISFYLSTDNTDGNITLNVMFWDYIIKSYDCNEIDASADENFSNLVLNGKYYFERASRYFRYSLIEILYCNNLGEFISYGAENSADYIRRSVSSFLNIFTEILAFISFHMR